MVLALSDSKPEQWARFVCWGADQVDQQLPLIAKALLLSFGNGLAVEAPIMTD